MEFIDKIEKTFSKADYDRIMAAYDFAAIAHANTYRKGTRIPYIKHPIEAAEVVLEMTSDPSIIIATLLHDVVENTHYSIADIYNLSEMYERTMKNHIQVLWKKTFYL